MFSKTKSALSRNKKLLIPALFIGILALVATIGTQAISAYNADSHNTMVQKIAERFNLKSEEVEEVFEEFREEKHQKKLAYLEGKLDEAIADGTITAEQKQIILAKKAEMFGKMEELKDLSPEERKEAMQELKLEMQTWAQENGINLHELFMQGSSFKGHHHDHKFGL